MNISPAPFPVLGVSPDVHTDSPDFHDWLTSRDFPATLRSCLGRWFEDLKRNEWSAEVLSGTRLYELDVSPIDDDACVKGWFFWSVRQDTGTTSSGVAKSIYAGRLRAEIEMLRILTADNADT